jgi:hypothetical protein
MHVNLVIVGVDDCHNVDRDAQVYMNDEVTYFSA